MRRDTTRRTVILLGISSGRALLRVFWNSETNTTQLDSIFVTTLQGDPSPSGSEAIRLDQKVPLPRFLYNS